MERFGWIDRVARAFQRPRPATTTNHTGPLALWQVLEDEWVALHGALPPAYLLCRADILDRRDRFEVWLTQQGRGVNVPSAHVVQRQDCLDENEARDALVTALVPHLHDRARSALCFSGGGIRSATFGLGVLQGLAARDVLSCFDYLSTVSGGGYLGSWLTAWLHRSRGGLAEVGDELAAKARSPLAPEARPVRHLRAFSNYLSPKVGMMSADTWTLLATYARNLLVNWLVLVPMLLAILMLPRMSVAMVRLQGSGLATQGSVVLGSLLMMVGLVFIGVNRPSARRTANVPQWVIDHSGQDAFLLWCLLPILLAVLSLSWSFAWSAPQTWLKSAYLTQSAAFLGLPPRTLVLVLWATLVNVAACVIYSSILQRFAPREMLVVTAVGISGGLLAWLAAAYVLPEVYQAPDMHQASDLDRRAALYATFAVPVLLGCFLLAGTAFVGASSRWCDDDDLEWWARLGAWALVVACMWAGLSALVIFGPTALLRLAAQSPTLLASAGGAAGLISILGGWSGKTAATNEHSSQGLPGRLFSLAIGLAAPLFLLLILMALSLATSEGIAAAGFVSPLPSWLSGSLATTAWSHEAVHRAVIGELGVAAAVRIAVGFLAIGLGVGIAVNLNKFSLHGMYRSRLIRAYLGASREQRDPNAFTGFDEADNVFLHEIHQGLLFDRTSIADAAAIARCLTGADPTAVELLSRFTDETRQEVWALAGVAAPPKPAIAHPRPEALAHLPLLDRVLYDLNSILLGPWLGDCTAFRALVAPEFASHPPTGWVLVQQNRRLVAEACAPVIGDSRPAQRPFHVVNTALNLVGGGELAWQERKAQSFTFSALHAGSFEMVRASGNGHRGTFGTVGAPANATTARTPTRPPSPVPAASASLLGYRRTQYAVNGIRQYYGGAKGVSLGTAMTISGAAANPNMGYHSSGVVTFLMTLFNVRLGCWLGNPGERGVQTFDRAYPKFFMAPLIADAFGFTDANRRYVNLSDGGHFENLGVYEMVVRRCRIIVVSDGSQDPKCSFDDLGSLVAKVRVDLGIPIDLEQIPIYARDDKEAGPRGYCAIGFIRYGAIDRDEAGNAAPDGVLVYLKPAICGGEPVDVRHYAAAHPEFPHETTNDQWFSESQFESYRALGQHLMSVIVAPPAWRWQTSGDFTKLAFQYASKFLNDKQLLGQPPWLAGASGRLP